VASGAGSLLESLSEDDRRRVLNTTRRRKYRRGEVLFHEGDPGDTLHLIDKGHVAVRTSTPLGDIATLTVLGQGEAFGEGALLSATAVRTASAIALDPVETHTLHREQFEELRRANPGIDRFLVEVLAAQVRRLSAHLLEALYVPAETRVLRRVVALLDAYPCADGRAVIPVTQDDIATMAGTSRPTANRVLRTAEDAGILAIGRGRIEVLDSDALANRAK
jgi:CRP/FNR family transcriptional regulator, cyclic AMP receptor protein